MRGFFVAAVAAVLLGGACSAGDNIQYLPIGSRCTESGQCGTTPYFCHESGYPGGYCEKPCVGDGDCPADAICAGSSCRRKCLDTSQCRSTEGYICMSMSSSPITYCEYSGMPAPQPDMASSQ